MAKFQSLLAVIPLLMIVNAIEITHYVTRDITTTITRYCDDIPETQSPYSNYTFVNSTSSSASSIPWTYSELSTSSQTPEVVTTTRVNTRFSVINSASTGTTTNSDGKNEVYTTTSQSRVAVGSSIAVATITTVVTEAPSAEVVLVTTSAVTTTKTIFAASSTPSSVFEGTSASSVTTSGEDPLFTNSQSTQSQEATIATSSLTKDRTITSSTASTSTASSHSSGSDHTAAADADGTTKKVSGGTVTSKATTEAADPTSSSSLIISSAAGYYNSSSITQKGKSSESSSSSFLSSSSLSEPSTINGTTINGTTINGTTISSTAINGTTISSTAINGTTILSSTSFSSETSISPEGTTSSSVSSSDSISVSLPSSQTTTLSTSSETTASTVFDLFSVISTDAPPSVFPRKELPLKLPDGVSNDGKPIQTNKFWGNLILSEQTDSVWTYPYGFYKSVSSYFGLAVTQTNASQRVFGDYNDDGVARYYYNPIGLGSFIFSADDFASNNLGMDITEMKEMSTLVTLYNNQSSSSDSDFIDISLVQGMGFATAVYNGALTPLLNTVIGFSTLVQETSDSLDSKILKYRATLNNGVSWLIYVTLPSSSTNFKLSVSGSYSILGSTSVDGLVIQVARAPSSDEVYYDQAAGLYVTDAVVEGTFDGSLAAYDFKYTTKGDSVSGYPLIFALPHHLSSFTSTTTGRSTGISLDSTTKGTMYAYLTDTLSFQDSFNTDVQWLPYSQQMSGKLSYTSEQLQLLASVANDELNVDFTSSTSSLTTYYAGKFLDKYAYILLVIDEIIQDESVRNSTLERLKDAFDTFLQNNQYYPLMYDTRYGGVTSTAAQDGDTSADFGGPYYNDHHFHYGYFVHAAAVIGYIDNKLGGTWVEDNKDWVNSLVRDVANPSTDDSYFPVSRMFDWFAGHSWAAGLFTAGDGKNEESTSEDYNFAYGMKLWGNVVGDQAMEARGNLMISIMAKSMNDYFLYSDDNTIEPSEIIGNKVSGILFDNKIDHTTWFGTNTEYIHGIHMLPVTPVSSIIRGPTFVSEEWEQVISPIIDSVDSGWTGILRLNQALTDPSDSYSFFSQDDFSSDWLDNGLSRTWCLAFSGGLANST